MSEEFRSVPGFDGYSVSSTGRLINVVSGRSLKPSLNSTGYLRYCIRKDGRSASLRVHRAVALAWLGLPPEGKTCVAHLDGCRTNNAASNLAWVSYAENEAHKEQHGTVARGQRNHASKLTERHVLDMRSEFARGASQSALGRKYGISHVTVREIVQRKWWKHVDRALQTAEE